MMIKRRKIRSKLFLLDQGEGLLTTSKIIGQILYWQTKNSKIQLHRDGKGRQVQSNLKFSQSKRKGRWGQFLWILVSRTISYYVIQGIKELFMLDLDPQILSNCIKITRILMSTLIFTISEIGHKIQQNVTYCLN